MTRIVVADQKINSNDGKNRGKTAETILKHGTELTETNDWDRVAAKRRMKTQPNEMRKIRKER